jgi:hypothetical protein
MVTKGQLGSIKQKQERRDYSGHRHKARGWHITEEQTICYDLDDESEAGMGST